MIILMVSCYLVFAQECYRNIDSFLMAPGGYDIYGTGSISEDENGQLIVRFDSNFNTAGGPDVHVFLSKTFTAPNDNNPDKLEIGILQNTTGAQSYIVPSNVNIADYSWVLIHCITYDHFWGGGMCGGLIGNCTASGIDNHNPLPPQLLCIKGTVFINNLPDNTSAISVYDILGQRILVQNFNKGSSPSDYGLNLQNHKGIFFLHLKAAGIETTYRFVLN